MGDCLYWEGRYVCETLKSTSLQSEPYTHVNYLADHHIEQKFLNQRLLLKNLKKKKNEFLQGVLQNINFY